MSNSASPPAELGVYLRLIRGEYNLKTLKLRKSDTKLALELRKSDTKLAPLIANQLSGDIFAELPQDRGVVLTAKDSQQYNVFFGRPHE